MSKTQATELPKPSPEATAAAPETAGDATGLPDDDRMAMETAAGRHEGGSAPQEKP